MMIRDRESDFGPYLNRLGLTGVGVEVGVHRAAFAAAVLRSWGGRCLHLVDHWGRPEDEAAARAAVAADPRARVLKGDGVAAAARFPDGSLDWVYLDAGHTFPEVWADLEAWWPKVRAGGLVAGHDYLFGVFGEDPFAGGPNVIQVQPAVDRFVRRHGCVARYSWDEFPTWWCVKPAGDRPRAVVLSGATPGYPAAGPARANHEAYCRRLGLEYRWAEVGGYWGKVDAALAAVGATDADWLFWVDADAVFTGRRSVADFAPAGPWLFGVGEDRVSSDRLNDGCLFVRNCPEAAGWLRRWRAMGHWDRVPPYDNGAFIELYQQPAFREAVEVVPHRLYNSYPSLGLWGSSDLVAHFPGTPEAKAMWVRSFAALADTPD